MKKVLLVLCWGCFSAHTVGMFEGERDASSSNGSFQQVKSLNEEASNDDLEIITNGIGHIKPLALPQDSPYLLQGREYLQIILDQNQKVLETKLGELSEKEKYINAEGEKNPFVKAKQQEIDDLKKKGKAQQQEMDYKNQLINQKDSDLLRSRKTINSLTDENEINKQKISEQSRVIDKQSEEMISLKAKADGLEEKIREKDKQIQIKDQELYLVANERDIYKNQNKKYKSNFKLINDAVNLYAASWAEKEKDFKKQYDEAESVSDKIAVVLAHLITHSAGSGGSIQKQPVLNAGSEVSRRDLSLNTIVDVARHDFLFAPKDKANSFQMGRYIYIGNVNKENKPDGKGKITDKSEVISIEGFFREGFLDITKPLTFKRPSLNCEFLFPAELTEEYRDLISFVDISDMVCSFGVENLILKHPDDGKISFIFKKDSVYVGGLGAGSYPEGRGVKFCESGEIQDGEFLDGYFVGGKRIKPTIDGGSANPTKRKRLE
jgi:hypothetical protein